MIRWTQSLYAAAVFALLCVFFGGTKAGSADCSRHCFEGSLAAISEPGNFRFEYIPCIDSVTGQIAGDDIIGLTCQKVGADELHIDVQSTLYTLSWIYNSTAACDTAFANSGSFAVLVSSAYTALQGASGAGSSLAELGAVCGSDCSSRCFSIDTAVELPAGSAAAGPCGPANTTTCQITVDVTLTPCTGIATQLELSIGTEGVAMSAYDPAVLDGGQLTCTDGVLQLNSARLYIEWTRIPDQSCDDILAAVTQKAITGIEQIAVRIGDELWSSIVQQSPTTALASSMCELVDQSIATDDATDADGISDSWYWKRQRKPVTPFVTCGYQINDDLCCTVFGYRNPNTRDVLIPRKDGWNWFVPNPVARGQKKLFRDETEKKESFSILWPCKKHVHSVLTWHLKHPARLDKGSHSHSEDMDTQELTNSTLAEHYNGKQSADYFWHRKAIALRTRHDCSASQRDEWCQPLI